MTSNSPASLPVFGTPSGSDGSAPRPRRLSEPQQSLVHKLADGWTLQHEAQTSGVFRISKDGIARTVHTATVVSLLDAGILQKDATGLCLLSGPAQRAQV